VQGFDFTHQDWHDGVLAGVASGALPKESLDLAVSRVLKVKARLGLLDQPFVEDTSLYHKLTTSEEHEKIALEAARKAMCLLQNEIDTATGSSKTVLPLDMTKLKSLAVVGPNADQPQCGDYAAGADRRRKTHSHKMISFAMMPF
jgi:beta-glucosidase